MKKFLSISKNKFSWKKICKGIEDGKHAFCGPHTVQIDLTDKCNNACIGCWVHSPLLDKKEIFPQGEKELPYGLVKKLIEDLHALGTREIFLSGSGEPFMYPKILDVIKLIKSKGMYLNIVTNAGLLDERISRMLVKLGVDLITASIWAGSLESYIAIHPDKDIYDFEKIKTNLEKIAAHKRNYNSLFPHVKIYNVICAKNYQDIGMMVNFAKDLDADSLEFQIIDIIKGKTDNLALNSASMENIINQFEDLKQRKDMVFFVVPKETPLNEFSNKELYDLGKIWKNYKEGFEASRYCASLKCKKNVVIDNERIVISENTSVKDTRPHTFWYEFRNKKCQECKEKTNCLDNGSISVKLMNILGVGSFIRRGLSAESDRGIYEEKILASPCYIGWYYARVLTNGDVIPCCKAASHPLGSLCKNSFSEIWNSSAYEEFRFKARTLPKSAPYFSKINCIKSCDNWGMNLQIAAELKESTFSEEKQSYFKVLVCNMLKNGFRETFHKVARNLTPSNLRDRYLEILGIYDGEHAYKGPFHVQIDLTNNCNNNCIACWCNSPLLKEKRLSEEEKKQYLPLSLIKEFLDEISHMGATEVYFSGGGEPFMHPNIMEILEYTKRKNLLCHVNTNFTLLDTKSINRIIEIEVDFLTVSTWAATADTYIKTHSNKTAHDFYKIRENLIYLNAHKKDKPRIKLYNVLFNMNYLDVEKMVEFAAETGSESLEFTLVDTIPNATDVLALNKKELIALSELCKKIKSKLDKNNRVKTNGILLFQFDQFLRRISVFEDAEEAKYDKNIIDSMPCYIGWLFARVIPNGEVHSCLKAHRVPTGSLYQNRFHEIWNSPRQAYFRKKTLVYKKTDPFFRLIGNDPYAKEAGCYKSCDDIGRNMWMHNRLKMLSLPEKAALKILSKTAKIAKRLRPKQEIQQAYHNNPVIAGIIHGRKAFAGPEQAVIDPTNRCNLRCISCWLYSPLLRDNKPSDGWLRKELPKDTLIKLIDELTFLGTKRIRFTGGGEPFLYKDLMDVIAYARKKELLVAITTNFGLVSKKQIKQLIDLGIEELAISIWASNPEVYEKVHPGIPSAYFNKLKENLIYLKETKKNKPRVTFDNVIMNCNYMDFEDMYEFALKYGADSIYFTIADVFLNQTDALLLNENERKGLLEEVLKIKKRNQKEKSIQLEFFDGFIRRISKPKADFEKGEYDKADVDKIPCYAGWIFTRVLADGNVAPCCRGVKKIMGNINGGPFKDIWFSDRYNEFRAKAKYLHKSDAYFKDIGCIKECDNLMHNEQMHTRISYLL